MMNFKGGLFQALTITSVMALGTGVRNAQAAQEASCAKINVTQAKECSDLKVQFNLNACQDSAATSVQISCKQAFLAEASVAGATSLYTVNLTRNPDSTWTAGTVLKGPKPSVAPAPVAKTEAKVEAAPAPAAAPAAVASKGFTAKGSFRLRTEVNDKTDFASTRTHTPLRLRADLNWAANDETDFFLQPQASKTFGESVFVTSSGTTNSSQLTSGQSYDTTLSFHQAYVDYHPSEHVKFILGRQVLSYGDQMVVAAGDWGNVGRSFDALRTRLSYGLGGVKAWSDLFLSKIKDTNINGSGAGDKTLYGLYNSFNLGEYMQALDLYGMFERDASARPKIDLWVTGVRAKSKIGSFDYRVEYTKQLEASWGYQVDGEVGMTFFSANPLRIAPNYFRATHDYNQFYTSTHSWLGAADIIGRRNVQGGALHVSFGATKELTFLFDYFYFQRIQSNQSAYKKSGATLGNRFGSTSKALGQEFDLAAKYQLNGALNLVGGVSYFHPGAYFRDQYGTKKPTFSYLQLEGKF
jgi:hypothetical protein